MTQMNGGNAMRTTYEYLPDGLWAVKSDRGILGFVRAPDIMEAMRIANVEFDGYFYLDITSQITIISEEAPNEPR